MRLSLGLFDLYFFLLVSLVYGGAFAVCAQVFLFLDVVPWPWLGFLLPALGVLFVVTVIVGLGCLNLLLPPLKEGYHKAPLSAHFYLWSLYFSLNRILFLEPLKNMVLYSGILRYLAFKALGAKLAFGTSISANVTFTDLPMIEIGEGSLIGAYSQLTGHYINKGTLFLGKIKIGQRVNIGGYCRIAPAVEIGNDCWIGTDCQIAPMVTIGSGCTIEPMTYIPPGTRIPDGAVYPPEVSKA